MKLPPSFPALSWHAFPVGHDSLLPFFTHLLSTELRFPLNVHNSKVIHLATGSPETMAGYIRSEELCVSQWVSCTLFIIQPEPTWRSSHSFLWLPHSSSSHNTVLPIYSITAIFTPSPVHLQKKKYQTKQRPLQDSTPDVWGWKKGFWLDKWLMPTDSVTSIKWEKLKLTSPWVVAGFFSSKTLEARISGALIA